MQGVDSPGTVGHLGINRVKKKVIKLQIHQADPGTV